MTETAKPRPPGRREQNKATKERKIREAARALFEEQGYEATTLRQVSAAAGVGFGTVFAYATDKAGLLAMVYVTELTALPALFPDDDTQDTLDALMAGFAHLYDFWGSIPKLSKTILQQMELLADNPHLEDILARRARLRKEIEEWLDRRKTAGLIASDTDVPAAAATIFAVYTSAVREWSAGQPMNVASGLERLRYLLKLVAVALARA